jgi:uncharacterized repeat protein (TIGR01451 family)
MSSCTVTVDVTAQSAGPKANSTLELTFLDGFNTFTAGKAGATLDVELHFLIKVFTDDPKPPDGTVTLQFTLTNFDRLDAATGITFSDDLDATLAGLEAIDLPLTDPCGPGSLLSGTGVLALTGGNLGPEGSCTFGATLQVPPDADPGTYDNVTSPVIATIGGDVVIEDPATDDLRVATVPILSKSFVDDPVTAGDTVTLRFEVTNGSTTASATDIAFQDILIDGLPSVSTTPDLDPCGPGSAASFTPPSDFDPPTIALTGGNLAASESCTFDFILDVAEGVTTGTYVNTTSTIAATVDGETVDGPAATDTLEVVAAPDLGKEFLNGPVLAGGTVTLEFTLELDPESPGDVTDIAFTDDLDLVLNGLEADGLPINDVCGAGSQLSGTSLLTFTGGSLSPGAICTFSAKLQVPVDALPGVYTNTTSSVGGMSLGLAVSSTPASEELEVGGLGLTKSFTDDPALAGETVTLEFKIDNLSQVASASSLSFVDDLRDTLDGLAVLGLPLEDPCGAGSQLIGTGGDTILVLTGGNLAPQTSCTFSLTLQIPSAAEVGDYPNTTSQLTGDVGGSQVTIGPATDVLTVIEPLTLGKLFIGDPVLPAETVTLRFTIANAAPADSATGISFTDDLGAALAGLAAVGLPANDICGAGSVISGTGLLTFTGGSLGPASECTFDITLEAPLDAPLGTSATNVTSEVTGTVGGSATSGPPATDDLEIGEEICLAADGTNVTLQDDTVAGTEFFEVCDTIEVGPNYHVVGPDGNLTLRAGRIVIFRNGAAVTGDGRLTVGINPDLEF